VTRSSGGVSSKAAGFQAHTPLITRRPREAFLSRVTATHVHGGTCLGQSIWRYSVARVETAAIIYGTSTHYYTAQPPSPVVLTLPATLEHLRFVLGDAVFDERVAVGAAMEPAEGLRYARDQIRVAHSTLGASP
jgi:hypothetical protein